LPHQFYVAPGGRPFLENGFEPGGPSVIVGLDVGVKPRALAALSMITACRF
jgi:hypothetical protein